MPILAAYGQGQLPGFVGDPDTIADTVSNYIYSPTQVSFFVLFRIFITILIVGSYGHGSECNFDSLSKAWD